MTREPILKVSRPVAACQRCRTAKTKCDGKLPACSSCERAGKASECISTSDQFARGKERSYPAFLESKIIKLRAKLAEAEKAYGARGPAQDSFSPPPPPPPRPSSHKSSDSRPSSSKTTSQPNRKKENSEMADLVSNFGVLSINAASRDYQGFSSLMSVARVSLWAISRQNRLEPSLVPLPSKSEAMALGQQYLNNIFMVLPVIEKSTFWASLEAVYCSYAMPYNNYVLRMILATALIMRSENYGDEYYQIGGNHAMAAMHYVEDAFRPDDISSIQAMLLLTEYSRYDPRRFDNWTLVGALSRASVDLGLHQDPPKQAHMTRGRLEARRRVFMCVYTMDRLTSMAFGRALSFSDNACNVDVQASLLDTTLPNAPPEASVWMRPYEYGWRHFLIRQTQSAIWQDLHQSGRDPMPDPYSYVWPKWHELHQWFEDLPPSRPRPLYDLTKLEMMASAIQLLAPSPKIPVISELAQSLLFEYGIEYCLGIDACINDRINFASMSYTSGIRIRKIGGYFLRNFRENREWILRGATPRVEPPQKGGPSPPTYAYPARSNNGERTLGFIYKMSNCLDYLGRRFGIPDWKDSFNLEAQPIVDMLHMST